MITAMEEAFHRSNDPPDIPRVNMSSLQYTGKVGRPKIIIDPTFLTYASPLRGPVHLAPLLHCSSRTVRRRQLEQGLAQPAPPVYQDTLQEDGSTARIWTSTTAPSSAISDNELDQQLITILQLFPKFGRRMITGYLRSKGLRVPRSRIRSSYIRVHGAPPVFGDRRISRRVYHVPGVNSLWHHDGQHGMGYVLFPTF